jgi:hypothetical protein
LPAASAQSFVFSFSKAVQQLSVSRPPGLEGPWDFLAVNGNPSHPDVIFVLAGLQERKAFGLELFRQGFAPRLIISVGRFEVRKMDQLGFSDLNLRALTASLPPAQRHFFIDLSSGVRRVSAALVRRVGTFGELSALAAYLDEPKIRSMTLVSTSIHLRRVRWCCRRMAAFRDMELSYLPVPEELSTFRRQEWWKRPDHWAYVSAEFAKLLAYSFWFRGKRNA